MNNSLFRLTILSSSIGLILTACNSGSSSTTTTGPVAQALPASYQCLPSNLPTGTNSSKIAYAGNCSVESATETNNLQKMAVALEKYNPQNSQFPESGFYNNCSGTPIQYNSNTGVTFVLTAAHCVIGTTTPKPAGAPTTAANINTYVESLGHNQAWIYQGTNAAPLSLDQLNAQILAVYVPSQYCQGAAYNYSEDEGIYLCGDDSNISYMNGDFAVLKVQTQVGKSVTVASNIKLAPSNLNLISTKTNLLVLGYGTTNPNGTIDGESSLNSKLNYINTQYFGTNSYGTWSGSMTIMNGYLFNNIYYGLICNGDSGGGDFAWDGSNWNLVGVHSWGQIANSSISPVGMSCGVYGQTYVANASADVRQFNSWISNVLNNDNQPTGCADLGSAYACAAGTGK